MSDREPTAGPLRPQRAAPRPLRGLLDRLGAAVTVAGDPAGVLVRGATHDSRRVRPGDLYAALPGAHVHGAQFTAAAVAAGAVAVLTDPAGAAMTGAAMAGAAMAGAAPAPPVTLVAVDPRHVLGEAARWAFGDPTDDLLIVGITGTNGKTTTAYLCEAGLRACGLRTGLIGTVETRVAGRSVPSERTTPEATELQGAFAAMREAGVQAVAMEVSSHALALGRMDGTVVTEAVFTNLSQDHLDFHPDMESYYAAKASLFTPARSRRALVNLDDGYGRRLAGEATVPVRTFSAAGADGADWRAADVRPDGTFRALGPDGVDVAAASALPGRFNVANALAATAACAEAGLDPARAAAGVGGCADVPGRFERVAAGQPFTAVVDYAHTPQAVRLVLTALREQTAGRLIAVLGCGGDRDRGKRELMGRAAAEVADVVVVTDDNPRSEDPAAIRAAVLAGARSAAGAADVREVADRRAAIAAAVALARAGDTVVVAGKGHEQGQQYGDAVLPFDDRVALRAALSAAGAPA